MFAEKTDLKLVEDLNETALVELNAADIEDVSGAIVWAAIPIGWKVAGAIIGAGAAGGGIGYGIGYWSNRD